MSEPYYQDERVTLWHGDCLEHPEWWTGADVLVTDPPYGTQSEIGYGRRSVVRGVVTVDGRTSDKGVTIAGDDTTDTRDRALAMWGNRPAVLFGSPRLPDPPGVWDDRLVWNKKRPGMNGGPFRYTHESIYARGMVRVNNATFSVFDIHPGPDQASHIHAKPVPLMDALVATCPPGAIADPFAGSGSTLVAAKALGRNAIGVELEERYCEIAARRLSQEVLDIWDHHEGETA